MRILRLTPRTTENGTPSQGAPGEIRGQSLDIKEQFRLAAKFAYQGDFEKAARMLNFARRCAELEEVAGTKDRINAKAQEIVKDTLAKAKGYAEGKITLGELSEEHRKAIKELAVSDDDTHFLTETEEIEANSSGMLMISYIETARDFASEFGIEIDCNEVQSIHQELVNRRLEILMNQVSGTAYSLISVENRFDHYLEDTGEYAARTNCIVEEEKLEALEKAANKCWAIECLFFATFDERWDDILTDANDHARNAELNIDERIRTIRILRNSRVSEREYAQMLMNYFLKEAENPLDPVYIPLYLALAHDCAKEAGVSQIGAKSNELRGKINDRISFLYFTYYEGPEEDNEPEGA